MDVAPVTAFETGTNTWRRLPGWPASAEATAGKLAEATAVSPQTTPLYLGANLGLSFSAPKADRQAEFFSGLLP